LLQQDVLIMGFYPRMLGHHFDPLMAPLSKVRGSSPSPISINRKDFENRLIVPLSLEPEISQNPVLRPMSQYIS
jgi:hypothetical protein